jgi:hypothetical protein
MCGLYSGVSSYIFGFFLGFVLLAFFIVWFKCPLTVASYFSRYFFTCYGVSVGQVVKFPAFIAFMNVDGTGEPAAACKYCMASYTLFISYTLFMDSSLFVLFLSNGNVHNPVVWSRCPCMTIRPCTATLPSITCARPSSNSTLYPASHICPQESSEWLARSLMMNLTLRLNVVHAKSAVALDDKVVPSGSFTLIGMWACRLLMQHAPRLK